MGGLGAKSNAAGKTSSTGFLSGLGNRKPPSDARMQAAAKKKYKELFSNKKTYEVRLSNKSLAMKRGYFMGMAEKNTLAVFESKRLIVAVPADKLSKKLADQCEDRIESAKEIFTETGVAFEDVMTIPEEGDQKTVGLAGREKIKMFVHRKPKVDKKKTKKQKEQESESAATETKADEPIGSDRE